MAVETWVTADDLASALGLPVAVTAHVRLSVPVAEAEVAMLLGHEWTCAVEASAGPAWCRRVKLAVCLLAYAHALPGLSVVVDTSGDPPSGLLGGSYEVTTGEATASKRYLPAADVARFAGMLRGQAFDVLGKTGLALLAVRDDVAGMAVAVVQGQTGAVVVTPGPEAPENASAGDEAVAVLDL